MFVKRGTCSKNHATKICVKMMRCNACNKTKELFKTKESLIKCPFCGSPDVIETSVQEENKETDVENRDQ